MNVKKVLFSAAFTLLSLNCFADSNSSTPSSSNSVATATSSFAKSTVSMAQDTAITTYIYAKMAAHPNLARSNIDISTQNGKVFVNGIVSNTNQAQEITQLAESTTGVKNVDSSKLIIGQESRTLIVKDPEISSIPQIDPDTNKTGPVLAQAEPVPTAKDPLFTDARPSTEKSGNQPVQMQEKEKPAARSQTSPPQHKLSKKCKSHPGAKHKSAHKKTAKKYASKKILKKKIAHHHQKTHKALAHHKKPQPKSVLSQKKSPHIQVASRSQSSHNVAAQNPASASSPSKESVNQMTNDYLKQALTANQPIPEE